MAPGAKTSCFWVAALALAVFWPVVTHDFVNFDDDVYVTESPLAGGITAPALREAFTKPVQDHWVPLTWISHGVDFLVFGRRPWGHFLVNLLLHLANALLLLLALRRLTGDAWRSTLVATLFAVHPLQVETVAWAAERKGLLSSFFLLLALWQYAAYVARPTRGRYAAILAAFGAALLSKASVVMLPCLLLVLDWWPLGRRGVSWPRRILEKLPLFLLAGLVGCVAVWALSPVSFLRLPVELRLGYAAQGCGEYLRKFVWPSGLSVSYPHPGAALARWPALCVGLLLGAISLGAFRLRRNRPHLLAGWLWFLIGLAPLLGFGSAGLQAMADRYMYVPLIGLALAAVWELPLWEAGAAARWPAAAAGVLVCSLMVAAALQVRHWRNSVTLFQHALDVEEADALAHYNLGGALLDRGAVDGAVGHFRRALELDPRDASVHNTLGGVLAAWGDLEGGVEHFEAAARLAEEPELAAIARANLAKARTEAAGRSGSASARHSKGLEP